LPPPPPDPLEANVGAAFKVKMAGAMYAAFLINVRREDSLVIIHLSG
jgi:hypothetical protein